MSYMPIEYLSIIPAVALGYLASKTVAYPTSRIRKKLPNIKTKRIQVFPVIRAKVFNRVIHLHHYLYFSAMLIISFFVSLGILDLLVTKGFLLGGIIHGLWKMPKGHRKIIYRDFSMESLTSAADRR